jgi:hypothetical protein
MFLLDFFDKDKPCPEHIPNCNELRQKYFLELEKMNAGCTSCETRKIRDKYLDILINYNLP